MPGRGGISEKLIQDMSMTGELKSSRSKMGGAKRPSSAVYGSEHELDYDCYQEDLYDRVYDYQRVPSAAPPLAHSSSLAKRARSSSSRQRRSRESSSSKSSRPHSSNRAKLKMEELQTIKRELTLIKVQIDGLLDSLDRMDRQRQEHTGSPFSQDGSLGGSPYHPSASSREGSPRSPSPRPRRARRDSPELGEASDDDSHMMNHHNSDLEDEM
uniref:Heterogeneous nuclear ribonucleoprotein C-like n=1 Tax=Astyanax mexicanus TaxID=7994 RepID=A0A3B1JT72_ASTMX